MTRAKPSIQTPGVGPVIVDALDMQRACKAALPILAIHLRWDLSRAAGQKLAKRLPSLRVDDGNQMYAGEPITVVELTIKPTSDDQTLCVLLEGVDASASRWLLRQLETAQWECAHESQSGHTLDHVDVLNTIKCSVLRTPCDDPHDSKVLFVRTHWLEELGIEPGSYALAHA